MLFRSNLVALIILTSSFNPISGENDLVPHINKVIKDQSNIIFCFHKKFFFHS